MMHRVFPSTKRCKSVQNNYKAHNNETKLTCEAKRRKELREGILNPLHHKRSMMHPVIQAIKQQEREGDLLFREIKQVIPISFLPLSLNIREKRVHG